MRKQHVPVAVIGAGPYGLSVSAHLSARGATPALFGRPMDSWRYGTPPSMRLKSEGFASSLSDADGEFTLKAFCQAQGLPYADIHLPTPVQTFVAYGDAFQKRYAPQLDTRLAREIRPTAEGFEIELEDGATLTASQCVIATGLSNFEYAPPTLAGLGADRLKHTAQLSDYSLYRGARTLVVGAGASATNAAGELLRLGVDVTLTCRSPRLWFPDGGAERTWKDSLLAPLSPVGPGWSKWGVCRFPGVFRALPESFRVKVVDNTLGPAPAWYVRKEIEDRIKLLAGQSIVAARETADGVEIDMVDVSGQRSTHTFDQVIAGSGYHVDVERLRFLSPSLLAGLARIGGAPRLSRNFETSAPGLYFVGVAAAYAFGPQFRFVCGAEYASRRVSAAIAAKLRKAAQKTVASPDLEVAALKRKVAEMKRLPAARKILFVNLLDDPGPDRLVAEIGRRGVDCEIVAAKSSFAARTRFARRVHRLPDLGGAPLSAFVLARRLDTFVERSAPDLIVPLDELAAGVLRDARLLARVRPATRNLLVASLGAADKFPAARSRGRLAALASKLNLRTPRTAEVADLAAARRAAAEFGFPLVLKRELTAGGGGVLIIHDDETLARAFRRSQFLALAKSHLGWIEGYRGEAIRHIAQEFIAGDLVFRNSACRDGAELVGVNFMAERRDAFETTPSRRIRCVHNEEMERSTRAVIDALGLSGFVSLDFIVDGQGRAHLLELNSRPTGSTHLGKLFGADLIAALLGSAPEAASIAPTSIALFPKAIDGDPFDPCLWGSPGLLHDVPWEDPELLDGYSRWLAGRHPDAGRQFAQLRAKMESSAVEAQAWPAMSEVADGVSVLEARAAV